MNTLETKHPKKQVEAFGKEASEFTRKMVEGKLVRIELDRLKTRLPPRARGRASAIEENEAMLTLI